MIRRIEIDGLGPHERTRLDLSGKGVDRISGRSQAGKSTLMDAVCFVLWGKDRHGKAMPLEAIREGHEAARVLVELASGTTLERTLRLAAKGNRGAPIRTLTPRGGEPQGFKTEDQWRAAIKQLGDDDEAIRLAMVPMAWVPLHDGPGDGRPLRDVLSRMIPSADARGVIAEIMGRDGERFQRGDPVNESDASQLLTRANKQVVALEAAVQLHADELDELEQRPEPTFPGPGEAELAGATLDLAATWDALAPKVAAWERRATEIEAAQKAVAEWDRRRAQLGDEPEAGDELDRARAAAQAANKAFADAEQQVLLLRRQLATVEQYAQPRQIDQLPAVAEALREVKAAERQVAQLRGDLEQTTDVCPTCERPGWTDRIEALQARLEDAGAVEAQKRTRAQVIREEVEATEAQRVAEAEAEAAALKQQIAEAVIALSRLEEAKEAARDAVAAARAAVEPVAEWHASMRGLGQRPQVPPALEQPVLPKRERPTAEELAHARAVLEQRENAAGQAKERARSIASKRAKLEEATRELERRRAEAKRLTALVAAIRQEPSESLGRQLSELGDLGPVEVRLRDAKGGVDVYVDGRPWRLSSTGRQVVADAWLRLGFRRALRLRWLLMFIDCTQDVGGQSIPQEAPCVLLTTTDEDGLTVEEG